MKKLIAVIAVLLFVAPAFAADWSFYGSQRMATFYVDNDYEDVVPAGGRFGTGSSGGKDDDWGLQWNFQGNSRLGARVKADKVSGHLELSLSGTATGDGPVGTRRAYATWKFMDDSEVKGGAHLKVGKDYTPVSQFLSGQVFDGDIGLLSIGDFYGQRPSMVGLNIGNLELALITNPTRTPSPPGGAGSIAPAGSDVDWNIPKFEAAYTLKMDTFTLRPMGGINYFKVDTGAAPTTLTDEIEILSYVVGLGADVNIGAFRIGAQAAYGQNWANAGWASYYTDDWASGAVLINGDDVKDSKSWMAMLVAGLKFTDTVNFEIGGGYRSDEVDINGADPDEAWVVYGQVVLTLAPGVYIIPEVGYYDFMKNSFDQDEGTSFYAGAKWQIDF